jgi:hypothetical protein
MSGSHVRMAGLEFSRVGLNGQRRDNRGVTNKYPCAYQHRAHSVRTQF